MKIPSVIPSVNPLVIKKIIITEGYTEETKRLNLFFYYQRKKKLQTKDSPTEHFRR